MPKKFEISYDYKFVIGFVLVALVQHWFILTEDCSFHCYSIYSYSKRPVKWNGTQNNGRAAVVVVAKTSTKTVSLADGKLLFFFHANQYCYLIPFLFFVSWARISLADSFLFAFTRKVVLFLWATVSLSKNVGNLKSVSLVLWWLYGMLSLTFKRERFIHFTFFVISRCFCVNNFKRDRKCQLLFL